MELACDKMCTPLCWCLLHSLLVVCFSFYNERIAELMLKKKMLFFKLNILPLKTLERYVWSYAGKNLDTVGHLIKEVRKRDAVSMNVER